MPWLVSWHVLGALALGLASCSDSARTGSALPAGASGGEGGRRDGGAGGTAANPGGAGTDGGGSAAIAGSAGAATAPPFYGHHATPNPAGKVASLRVRGVDTGIEYDAVGRDLGDAGANLTPLVGYNQFWFAWSVFNHGSEVFRARAVETAPIDGDCTCAVPCEQVFLGCSGQDCIPALTAPSLVPPDSGDAAYLSDNSYVVGFEHDGDARAYPHNVLWWHEIVNDVVAGKPIAVTHCPLTFSTIAHDPTAFTAGGTVELGVSGRLFNSNLVFYNRSDDTWFSQLLGVGTVGGALGAAAPRVAAFEMTWAAWRALYPDSTVLSIQTGHARNYESYPYGGYFIDDADTFSTLNPPADPLYPNKAHAYGVRTGGGAKAWVHDELRAWAVETYGSGLGPRGVLNDQVGDTKLAIVFDLEAAYVQAFASTEDLELVR